MDMDISMDIHVKSVDMDMDMDVKIHIHGNPDNLTLTEAVNMDQNRPLESRRFSCWLQAALRISGAGQKCC